MRLAVPLAIVLVLAGCGSPAATPPTPVPHTWNTVDGLRLPARVDGPNVQAALGNGRWQTRFWSGVNLGSTLPGHQPGEVSGSRAIYDRWLAGMGALGVHVVRVYTILRPSFYNALRAYDLAHPGAPIYLIQGVWIPENAYYAKKDMYAPAVISGFEREIWQTETVIQGHAGMPLLHGHASGIYRANVSPWLLAWSLGVEWDPGITWLTDHRHPHMPAFDGRYFASAPGSTATEDWLAMMLDRTATLEAERGWSRPLTFTNWLTADPLHHPYEPIHKEDLVSIDATHIHATGAWPGGFFASYHVYPYYPDFMRLTPSLQHGDPYANYLHQLRAYHGKQAVMVTEFGVPTGIGIEHYGPLGRNQGGHAEVVAGQQDASMLRDIKREGYAGGLVFDWADEWFKFSWNTWDMEQPVGRRQLWVNALTEEEHFGIVAAAPYAPKPADYRTIATSPSSPVRRVQAAHNEEYLYLRIGLATPTAWRTQPLHIGFDIQPQGNRGLPGMPGMDPAADVALTIGPGDHARIEQAQSTDPIKFLYGPPHHYVPFNLAHMRPGSGVWDPTELMLNREYTIPATGQLHPTELADVSHFRFGPFSEPMNLISVGGGGRTLTVRVPYMYLTYADPSSNLVFVPHLDGSIGFRHAGPIGIDVVSSGAQLRTQRYGWPGWNTVRWHERRKAGWSALALAMAQVSASGG